MNRHSIFFTLGISFIISILLLIGSVMVLLHHDNQNLLHNLKRKYFPLAHMAQKEFNTFGFRPHFMQTMASMHIEFIEKSEKINTILQQPALEILWIEVQPFGVMALLKDDTSFYVHVQNDFDEFMLKDSSIVLNDNRHAILIFFSMITAVLILLGFITYKKLKPLRTLTQTVSRLGEEEFELSLETADKKDEVSLLAKELQQSMQKLKELKEARTIFIRNIMHELKTPIAKGKFLAELPKEEENRKRMQDVFYRLESLINEFAAIEEIIAKDIHAQKSRYLFNDLLDNALDMLMIEDGTDVTVTSNKLQLNVHFKLFSIMLKNLIDNALKYAPDHKVRIEVTEKAIIFINRGEPLAYPLERYFEPFFKSDTKKSESFGLGLYIISHIARVHEMRLDYEATPEGGNRFSLLF